MSSWTNPTIQPIAARTLPDCDGQCANLGRVSDASRVDRLAYPRRGPFGCGNRVVRQQFQFHRVPERRGEHVALAVAHTAASGFVSSLSLIAFNSGWRVCGWARLETLRVFFSTRCRTRRTSAGPSELLGRLELKTHRLSA